MSHKEYGRNRPYSFVLLLLFCAASRAHCALMPELYEDKTAWQATHVVVADEKGNVLECWKGDARRSERIDLDKLSVQRHALMGGRYPGRDGYLRSIPRQYTQNNRFILFLVDADPTAKRRWESTPFVPGKADDEYFNNKDINFSMAWIENDGVYAFKTGYTDTPEDLGISRFATLAEFRSNVGRIIQLQHQLRLVLGEKNENRRAWKIAPFVTNKSLAVRYGALNALTRLHSAAMPVLHRFLFDPSFGIPDQEIIQAIALAGGRGAVPDLVRFARSELAFWRIQAPQLKANWTETGNEILETRRDLLHEALHIVSELNPAKAKHVARELQALWHSSPSFYDGWDKSSVTSDYQVFIHGQSSGQILRSFEYPVGSG